MNNKLLDSVWALGALVSFSGLLSRGKDSPVRTASFIWSSFESTILISAGTMSPTYTVTRSPGAKSLESISVAFPSLVTTAFIDTVFSRSSTIFEARNSL
jgi:hypothetical protein